MGKRAGDTLIEVTLAVGIFSLVAIGVVAVMSGGTSSAQTSLEATLAREEIDTQAEALRFIQSSYIADKDSGIDNNYYANLWAEITKHAVTIDDSNAAYISGTPSSCADSYNNDIFSNNAFIIDPRNLGSEDVGKTIVTAGSFGPDGQPILTQSTTYPRLIYNSAQLSNQDSLVASNTANNLYRAEGIYIVAVADNKSTQIVQEITQDQTTTRTSAFYDFYIRSCWYGTTDETPSTISTVIRLYNPRSTSAISTNRDNRPITVYFMDNNGVRSSTLERLNVSSIQSGVIPEPDFAPPRGYVFEGWAQSDSAGSATYRPGDIYSYSDTSNKIIELYPVYNHIKFNVTISPNGGSWTDFSQSPIKKVCYSDKECKLPDTNNSPARSGYKFQGWCYGDINNESCSGTSFDSGADIKDFLDTFIDANIDTNVINIEIKAVWKANNETLTVVLTWGSSPRDLDSHVQGQRSDNSTFHAYYGTKVGSDVSGLTIASLDQDVTRGYGPETFTINTLGGRNYYYYVHNFTNKNSDITNATVTVSGPYTGTHTYYASQASGSGGYWNVFAYKDGRIVYRGTRSSSPELNY